jgi:dTDP-4-dehydrorhamnose reductase
MKIAVIGSTGQLGVDLVKHIGRSGYEALAISGRAQLDVTDAAAVTAMLDGSKPAVLVNTASFHNVDLCEKEPEQAYRVNTLAVGNLAAECQKRNILLVQIGTDYVMEGSPENIPLPESAPAHPQSVYAITRFGGDCMTLVHAPDHGYVVRTCGLFGMAGCKLKGGMNFIDSMIAAARAGKPLRVVSDQVVAPTSTDELAQQLIYLIEKRPGPGLYHAVSHGECSWHEFAVAALKLAGIDHPVATVTSEEFAAPARRPRYSVLNNARLHSLGIDIMGHWQNALQHYVAIKYQ